jgi:quercetin dioxygenase-like cupin family protein
MDQATTSSRKGSLPPVRRIVTGHDDRKSAKVIWDGPVTQTEYPREGRISAPIWCTFETPTDISLGENIQDMAKRKKGTPPPQNGTHFVVNDIMPGNAFAMHRTETIDYVIVLFGEIDMILDESTVSLKQGDIVVQRGTNHAWVNRGTEPARLVFILIDGKPLGIGNPLVRGSTPSDRLSETQ